MTIDLKTKFFSDPRLFQLARRLGGDFEKAIGRCVESWLMAQFYWTTERGLIPKERFDEGVLESLLACDLAVERPEGIYCRGSDDSFAWLAKFSRSKGGKNSAAKRAEKFGSSQPPNGKGHKNGQPKWASETSEVGETQTSEIITPQPKTIRSELAISELLISSSFLSSVSSPTSVAKDTSEAKRTTGVDGGYFPVAPKIGRKKRGPKKAAAEPSKGSLVWLAYAEAFTARYGEPPLRNAKANTLCTQLVARLGEAGAEVARFYLSHSSQFYVARLHPLGLLVMDAEKLHTEWKLGRQMTASQAKRVETVDQNVQVLNNYIKGASL